MCWCAKSEVSKKRSTKSQSGLQRRKVEMCLIGFSCRSTRHGKACFEPPSAIWPYKPKRIKTNGWSNNFHIKRHFCIQGAYDNQILPVWLLPLISRSSSWNSLGAHDSRPRVRVAVLMLLHFKVLLMKLNIKQRDWGLGRPPNHVDSRALSIQPSKRTNLKQILMLCQQFQVRGLARAVAVIKSEQLGPRWPKS